MRNTDGPGALGSVVESNVKTSRDPRAFPIPLSSIYELIKLAAQVHARATTEGQMSLRMPQTDLNMHA